MAQAAESLAQLRPFHTSGSLRGGWEYRRETGSMFDAVYVVKSYGATIARVRPIDEGALVEIEGAQLIGYLPPDSPRARHIKLTIQALEAIPRATT